MHAKKRNKKSPDGRLLTPRTLTVASSVDYPSSTSYIAELYYLQKAVDSVPCWTFFPDKRCSMPPRLQLLVADLVAFVPPFVCLRIDRLTAQTSRRSRRGLDGPRHHHRDAPACKQSPRNASTSTGVGDVLAQPQALGLGRALHRGAAVAWREGDGPGGGLRRHGLLLLRPCGQRGE